MQSTCDSKTCADVVSGRFGSMMADAMQVKAALTGALFPNVAVMADASQRTGRPGWNDGVAEVALHPACVAHPLQAPRFGRPFLVYLEKVPLRPSSHPTNFPTPPTLRMHAHEGGGLQKLMPANHSAGRQMWCCVIWPMLFLT